MKNKLFIIIFLFILTFSANINSQQGYNNIILLKGSKIYARILLFFFPISDKYESFYNFQEDSFNLEISIQKSSIKNEPSTPSYFDSNLIFHIKNIPYDSSGNFVLPVTIQCNKKFINKKVNFKIFRKDQILILKGEINNLNINEITDNKYFKKRFKWKYPLHFDIRLFLSEGK